MNHFLKYFYELFFQILLHETSANIYNLTAGRVQLRDVYFRLPASWAGESCAPASTILSNNWPQTDLLVTESHPLLQDIPWTLQYQGCGKAGKGIELPLQFISKNSSLSSRAEMLTKEWVKYKFGVFAENGFSGDNLYPSSFMEGKLNITNSGCTNKLQASFFFRSEYLPQTLIF